MLEEALALENLARKREAFCERNLGAEIRYRPPAGATHTVTIVNHGETFVGHGVSYEDAIGEALVMAIYAEKPVAAE